MAELKLNKQTLFRMPILGINIKIPITIDDLRIEWEFGSNNVLDWDEELIGLVYEDNLKLAQKVDM